MRHLITAAAVALAAGSLAGHAEAQPRRARPPQADQRGKVLQRIRAMRAWQLTEALGLDEVTAGRLFPVLNRFDGKLQPLRTHGDKLRQRLERAMKKGASDATFRQLVTDIQKHNDEMHKWHLARFEAIRKVLSPRQAAIALVALPEIEQRIRQRILEAMDSHGGGEVKDPFK